MSDFRVATIAFNVDWAVEAQIRLFAKHVRDRHRLVVFDNSRPEHSPQVQRVCRESLSTMYVRVPGDTYEHSDALNFAAAQLLDQGADFLGFVDHDLWPAEPVELLPLIREHGFLCLGQYHAPTGRTYPWPGCLFLSREWLAGRPLDFTGIRGREKHADGDTGSGLWPLFSEDDWKGMFLFNHRYEQIRPVDDVGLQSWGVEHIGAFIHGTNTSGWKNVPRSEERTRLLRTLVESL